MPEKEEYIAQCMTTGKTREECAHLWDLAQTGDQQSKEDYMKQCVAGGKTLEECEKAWTESHASADYGTLIRENAMQKVKIDQLQNALREATNIIKAVNIERDAITDARKYELACEIEKDTEGRVKHGDLMKETLNNLSIMKKAIDVARPKDFVSVQQLLAKDAKKKTPLLTVGQWDADKKQWVGGK